MSLTSPVTVRVMRSPRRSFIALTFVVAAATFGCESTQTDADGGYVQSPMGYVPPYEMQNQVPIQIGPNPVPMIGGSPTIQLPDQSPAIELTATESGFEPAEIVVQPGQLVTVRLTNRSAVDRGLRVELPNAHASLPQNIAPDESRIIVFTAPVQAGTYVFYSSSTGERGGRLEGRLIVRESRPN